MTNLNKQSKVVFIAGLSLVVLAGAYFVAKAATYYWSQTSWTGGPDVGSYADHEDDQSNWSRFYSETSVDYSGGEVKLERVTN